MAVNYQKAWDTMNELEMCITKVNSAREILDVASETLAEHKFGKTEHLIDAAYEFLGYFVNEFDSKFKKAWQATVVAAHEEQETIQDKKYAAQYTDEELNAMCDAAEKQHSQYYYDYTRNDSNKPNPFTANLTIGGDGTLVLPDEVMSKLNINLGDYIQWTPLDDNTIRLDKVDNVSIVQEVN